MRTFMCWFIWMLIGLPPFISIGTCQQSAGFAAEIRSGFSTVISRSSTQAEIHRGLQKIIATLAKVAAKERGLPDGFLAAIETAGSRFRGSTELDPAGIAELNRAHEILNSGRKFAFPANATSIEQASKIARAKMQDSLKALEAGKSKHAIGGVLEVLLMIMTPMEAGS